MYRYSWIVFAHAIILSFESITVEFLQTSLNMSVLTIICVSIPISGSALIILHTAKYRSPAKLLHIFKLSKHLIPAAILLTIGILTWYDSVGRIGASKDGLIAGTLEIVVVLFFARLLLKEYLSWSQLAGVLLSVIGFIITISIGTGTGFSLLALNFGDIEAIASAICFASSYLFTAKIVKTESSIKITGFLLLLSGAMLFCTVCLINTFFIQQSLGEINEMTLDNWGILLLFSTIPLSSALFHNVGMKRIGASLTSALASSTILLTILFQFTLSILGYNLILPVNIPLAILGGTIGTLGICIINSPSSLLHKRFMEKTSLFHQAVKKSLQIKTIDIIKS